VFQGSPICESFPFLGPLAPAFSRCATETVNRSLASLAGSQMGYPRVQTIRVRVGGWGKQLRFK
jgi:hypothetical protein